MKVHISKAEIKARLARRAQRAQRQAEKDARKRKGKDGHRTLKSLFGRPYVIP